MSAAHEDLESLAEMLDTALTSQDPRVVSALRQLMIMVALTRPDAAADKNTLGPIRRLMSRVDDLHQRMERLEYELSRGRYEQEKKYKYDYDFKYRSPTLGDLKIDSAYRDLEIQKKLQGIKGI
jgi:hypothetical protein